MPTMIQQYVIDLAYPDGTDDLHHLAEVLGAYLRVKGSVSKIEVTGWGSVLTVRFHLADDAKREEPHRDLAS